MSAQQELEQARTAYKEVCEQLSNVRVELVGVTKEIEQAQQEQLECRERQELDEALCAARIRRTCRYRRYLADGTKSF